MHVTSPGVATAAARRGHLWSTRGLIVLAFSVLIGSASACFPTDPSPQAWTRSYYVANGSNAEMSKLGCYSSDMTGRMSLFFGAPTDVNGTYGATLWGGQDKTIGEIGEMVKDFVRGYAWCRTGGQQILVGMGTSTSGADNKPDEWMADHGHVWASVVKAVSDWADLTYPGIALVYGAWDAEPSWSAFSKADMWMQGYNAWPENRSVHVHMSADGCPRNSSDDGPCSNGWSQYLVWRAAWQYDPSLPMPQIYAFSGVNARQWQKIDEYGARYQGDGITFYGLMTQYGACMQVGGCDATGNLPHMGHEQLLAELNLSELTQQRSLDTVTDIYWHF